MGFSAAEVEGMAYDFNIYGGESGEIPEPTTIQLGEFWSDWGDYIDRAMAFSENEAAEREKATKITDTDLRLARLAELSVARKENAQQNIAERRKLLAMVCSDTPSVEQLTKLPGRVLDAFERYIFAELSPEASTAGTNP